MNNAEKLIIEGKIVFYIMKKDDYFFVYNLSNGKFLKTKQDPSNYLEDNFENRGGSLNSFIYDKKKLKLLNITIMSLVVNMSYLRPVITVVKKILAIPLTTSVLSIINIILIYFFLGTLTMVKISFYKNWFVLIGMYIIIDLFITFFHEISHYSIYQDKVDINEVRIGISFLYLYLPTFFTEVPFLNLLDKKNKRKIILAGIRMQLFIGVLFVPIYMMTHVTIIFMLIIINWYTILANMSPFNKMDGYWYVSDILGVDSYFLELRKEIKREKKLDPIVVIMGTGNLIVMMFGVYFFYEGIIHLMR